MEEVLRIVPVFEYAISNPVISGQFTLSPFVDERKTKECVMRFRVPYRGSGREAAMRRHSVVFSLVKLPSDLACRLAKEILYDL